MKKYATISMFVFWAVVVFVVIAGLHATNQNSSQSQANLPSVNNGVVSNLSGVSPSVSTLVLGSSEVSKHASGTSCWMTISGKVYDVTAYAPLHPNGAQDVLNNCGTDATAVFDANHSARSLSKIASYYIGDLNQTIKINSGSNSNTAVSQVKSSSASGQTSVRTVSKSEVESEED